MGTFIFILSYLQPPVCVVGDRDCDRCLRHASEAEERQRVLNKQRALDAKQVRQLRAQAKRRREQVGWNASHV